MAPAVRLLGDRVEHWAEATPDHQAVKFGERSWTWSQWRERIHRAAGALVDAGVGHGERVAFLDKNHVACLEITFAAAAIGAANAIINWRLAQDELDYVLNDAGAKVLFVGAELVPAIEAIRDQLTTVEKVVVVGDEYEEFLGADPVAPRAEVTPEDVCLVMYSSGTTGRPKGVMLTHRNVIAHTLHVVESFPFGENDRNLVAMPLFHVGGTCYAMVGIHAGVPSTITREPSPAALFGALADGVTHAFLVPAVIAGVVAAGEQAIAAFSRMKYLGYGASPMPLPLLRSALAAWPQTNFIQVYGMTELAGVISTLSPQAHRDDSRPERLASAGTLVAGAELRVVDPATGEDAEVGELWFRSEQVMAGYLGNEQATAETITAEGWLRSGDVGHVDDGGFLFISDRVKDMIITGGENVYSPEVERVLAEHPTVGDVAVIGVPDERWGESVLAVVTAADGQTVQPDELIAYCREKLAHYKCPRVVEVVDDLPRNPTGKILKKTLRQPHWQGRERRI